MKWAPPWSNGGPLPWPNNRGTDAGPSRVDWWPITPDTVFDNGNAAVAVVVVVERLPHADLDK